MAGLNKSSLIGGPSDDESTDETSMQQRATRAIVQITPRVLNPSETARYIGVGRSKLFELLASREIPAKKSGGQTLIEVSALDAWIDSLPPARAS
jgi:excisionase family DNA binding protein